MTGINPRFWSGRRVMVTGHMGFKGSWLICLLSRFGAKTVGYGMDLRPDPLLYRKLNLRNHVSIAADINDLDRLRAAIREHSVDTVFHLAAQSLVLPSYSDPLRTFRDNIIGTAVVLEAIRGCECVESAIMVTSDKVYANQGRHRPYREDDPLGGHDPYSASKAAAEMIVQSMAASFFGDGGAGCNIASVRAGNIIAGGDWAANRLIPDAARAYAAGETLIVRNPDAVRPWQHVLEPLAGYLMLVQQITQRGQSGNRTELMSWNFGPEAEDALTVRDVVERFTLAWSDGARWQALDAAAPRLHEAHLLRLDSSRARAVLGWTPRWRVGEAIERTARWYRDYYAGTDAGLLVGRDIDDYAANDQPSASRSA